MSRRVAILGAGIGAQHAAAYAKLSNRFEVVAVCDRDTTRAAAIAPAGARVVAALDPILADQAIDVVDICLPPRLHAAVAVSALASGKHVICEKPLALSLEEVAQIEAVSGAAQVFPVFQYRYAPAFDRLRALIAAGLAGRPLAASLETHWNRGADYYANPWRGTVAGEGGGALITHAIHVHDLVTHLMGPVDSAFAQTATHVNAIETEDCAAVSLRLRNGALVSSSVTLGAARETTRMRLIYAGLTATSGTMPYAPGEGDWSFEARDPALQTEVDAVLAATPIGPPGYQGFFQAVDARLAGADGQAVTLADGRAAVALAAALYASRDSGHAVAL
ncbi:MAG: Gfo/Idh/MocA family oxidoreductase [Pseudomonadota bacterium]